MKTQSYTAPPRRAPRARRGTAGIRAATGAAALGAMALGGAGPAPAQHAAASPAAPAAAPFAHLEWNRAEGVVTSRDGKSVWVSVEATEHRARLPGYATSVGRPEHWVVLAVECRAGGPGDQTPSFASLRLDNHPEAPDVFLVSELGYWWATLTGREHDTFPVRVRIGRHREAEATLVRPRIDYSAPRPGLHAVVEARAALAAIANGEPFALAMHGAGVEVRARFSPPPAAREAARTMRARCPG